MNAVCMWVRAQELRYKPKMSKYHEGVQRAQMKLQVFQTFSVYVFSSFICGLFKNVVGNSDRLCGLVVRVSGY
jgi:hypothetical protein